MQQREVVSTWDFRGVNTKEYTHVYHNYPAMMIPQIARTIIQEFAPKNTINIFDPYCGTGTTIVEAILNNFNAFGTDLNPLARLIANAKSTLFDIDAVKESIYFFEDQIFKFSFQQKLEYDIVNFHNIQYWFSDSIIQQLSFLKYLINNKIDFQLRTFFLVALSETIREASYTRNSEFKLYRIPKEKLTDFRVDSFSLFIQKCRRNLLGLIDFTNIKKLNNVKAQIFDFNTYICV